MDSILTVTTAASSYDLTTLDNVKAELNVSDNSKNTILKRYISSASVAAASYCNRVFQVETVSEQFFYGTFERYNSVSRHTIKRLQLKRWPLTAITSVTEDSTALVANTDYLADNSVGTLIRLGSDTKPVAWSPLPLTVVYSAGYATTPADVEDAVIRMVVKRYQAKGRDPSLKSENLPGVRDVTYWIATGTESGNMTPDITDILDGYRVPLTA